MRNLAGMTIVITGASAGIGEALARAVHAHGARLVLAARRAERLQRLARELPGTQVVIADVAKPVDCQRLIDAVAGPIDVLVCNAGYGLAKSIAETTATEWHDLWQTNVMGTTACIAAAVPRLRTQALRDGWRSQIMIVSSALARRGRPEGGAYSATKAAQLSIAEALRVELADDAIAVTSVHPIATTTEFVAAVRGGTWHTGSREPQQSAAWVAKCMARAMMRPRPEVWPHRMSRWGLSLATLWPSLLDRYFRTRRQTSRDLSSP